MLSEALDFPTSGERGSAALLVGSLVLLFSAGALLAGGVFPAVVLGFLLLQIVVRGYYVRVLRVTAVERSPVAPGFDDVGRLLRDGLGAVVVSVAYFLPSLLLFSVAAGGNLASAVDNPLRLREPATIAAAETVGSLAALLGLFSVLAALYLIPGAVTLYAHENRLRSAFALRRVVGGTLSEDYAVGWVVTLLLQALLFPIVLFLYSLLVGAFLHFFLAVAVRYIWGVSVGNALDIEPPAVDREGITPDQGVDPTAPGVAVAPNGDRPSEPVGDDGEDDGSTENRSRDPMEDESNR